MLRWMLETRLEISSERYLHFVPTFPNCTQMWGGKVADLHLMVYGMWYAVPMVFALLNAIV
jgi:hypothetical protein